MVSNLTRSGGGGVADQAHAVADAIKARAAPEMRRVLLGLLQGSSGSAEPSGKAKRRKKPSTSKATRRKKASSVDKRQLVRQRLEAHSNETPDVRFDAKGNSYEARRMLTKSRRRIWHDDSVLQQMFSLRAFCRHMRKEQRLYKNAHKKGDLCEVCLEYDTRVFPKVKAMIIAVWGKYRAIHNDFFAHFLARSDGAWLGQSASSADFACTQHVTAMVSYIDSCNADVPPWRRALSQKKQLDWVDADGSQICNNLRQALKDLRAFQWHFNTVQRQKQAALAQRQSLEAGSVYIQFDFMQNLSVPQSGAEAGSWWYANCRVEYTVFGVMLRFIVDGVPRSKFVTYVSNALDHGTLIASRLMQRVMTHVPHDTTKLLLWSDCGAHFRCYEFAHWALLDLPRKFRDERGVSVSVRLQFFAEKHGKALVMGFSLR